MITVDLDYIAAGGNRHPSAADWAPGLLAFGAGNNLAIWNPEDESQKGITALLTGHIDVVNAVKIYDTSEGRYIITGGADKAIRIWTSSVKGNSFEQTQCLTGHQGSINTLSLLPKRQLLVSGSADGTVKLWDLPEKDAKLVQSIALKPRYLPLTSTLIELDDDSIVLAIGGTSTSIQLFVRPYLSATFELQATLVGHEGWIRSLDFAVERRDKSPDIMLASASQDKFIRLWRLRRDTETSSNATTNGIDAALATTKKSLSNKLHRIGSVDNKYNVSFEALLIGHEDWIYTAQWAPRQGSESALKLLSASADNSIAIWEADESSGVWVCQTRLGEISAQKGSTTATGSTGGFWIGLWQPNGQRIASLGRTGSWRFWSYDSISDTWIQQLGISGHTQEVQSLAWATDGSYLLSTGSDQTTRLLAQWKREKTSWHEFARPQIHGYDLNCVDSLTSNQFISGADEKLLRVFNKPKAIDNLLSKLSGTKSSINGGLPDAANIPVLGLSNKAVAAAADDELVDGELPNGADDKEAVDPASVVHKSTLDLDHPPLEEHLARHTLWPEHEKLYGHGYEISSVAASHDGSMVATACKASSIDHAVIRIYECMEWREVKPPLTAHSLTVTSLAFSPDDKYLLSVGRDRQCAVFEKNTDASTSFKMLTSNPKGHSRMILDCSWAPSDVGAVFATAGRDKTVKIWRLDDGKEDCAVSIIATAPVTAISFANDMASQRLRLAYGTEQGDLHIVEVSKGLEVVEDHQIWKALLPSKAINALRWRPDTRSHGMQSGNGSTRSSFAQLAVASDDSSLRIVNVG